MAFLVSPNQTVVIKVFCESRLDYIEKWRQITITGRKQGMVPYVIDLLMCEGAAIAANRYVRQDRVLDRLECLCDQRGADRPCRIARSQGEHASPPSDRHWWRWEKIAREIEYVAHVISKAEFFDHKRNE